MNKFNNPKPPALWQVSNEDLLALYDAQSKSPNGAPDELRRELDKRLQQRHIQHLLLMAEKNIKLTKAVLILSAVATILAIIGLFKH